MLGRPVGELLDSDSQSRRGPNQNRARRHPMTAVCRHEAVLPCSGRAPSSAQPVRIVYAWDIQLHNTSWAEVSGADKGQASSRLDRLSRCRASAGSRMRARDGETQPARDLNSSAVARFACATKTKTTGNEGLPRVWFGVPSPGWVIRGFGFQLSWHPIMDVFRLGKRIRLDLSSPRDRHCTGQPHSIDPSSRIEKSIPHLPLSDSSRSFQPRKPQIPTGD